MGHIDRIDDVIDTYLKRRPGSDISRIQRAYIYSAKQHEGQLRKSGEPYLIHPIGVARIIAEMGLDDMEYQFTGGERGWIGDSPLVHLDVSKLMSLGWKPKVSVEDTIRKTVRWLLANPYVYNR